MTPGQHLAGGLEHAHQRCCDCCSRVGGDDGMTVPHAVLEALWAVGWQTRMVQLLRGHGVVGSLGGDGRRVGGARQQLVREWVPRRVQGEP